MSRVLAIRPEPGLTSTLAAGRALGLDIAGAPLFDVRPLPWECPSPAKVDALLIGSANAIFHGGDQLRKLDKKPIYAVGNNTAKVARDAGFTVAIAGTGGLQAVLDAVPVPNRLLRIAGAEHVPLTTRDGVDIQTVIAYESVSQPLANNTMKMFEDDPIVLIHSAAAARHFAKECKRLQLDKEHISLAVLGPRIADAAGEGWRSVHVSAQPNDAELLAMVRRVCQ